MRCEEFRKELEAHFGNEILGPNEKEHLAGCPECSDFYHQLLAMEEKMKEAEEPAMTADEFARMQMSLDEKISRYQSRASRFFRFSFRYGASFAAAVLLILLAYFGHFRGHNDVEEIYNAGGVTSELSIDSAISEIFAVVNSGESQSDSTAIQAIDDPYVKMLVGNYAESYGIGADESILGGISDEEMKYLKSKLKAGDIL
jgi:predicted anti-sigma-YlaC factor YlaD